jgi:hypothetical protein
MIKIILALAFLAAPLLASADDHTRIVEFWKCELKDGKEMSDVEANNKKWLAMTRKTAGSEQVNSYMMTTIVGDQTKFMFADVYPDMASWSAAKSAEESDEGAAIEATFDDLMECSDNRLYKSDRH